MSESKHTPGPWRVGTQEGDPLSIGTDAEPKIAYVYGPPDAIGRDGQYHGIGPHAGLHIVAVADARLIAAAPDLLVALTEMVAYFELLGDWENEIETQTCLSASRGIIRQAIGN